MPESSPAPCRFAIRASTALCFLLSGLPNTDSALTLTDFAGRDGADALLVSERNLSTYLPRTPPEKSYSALISRPGRFEGCLFVVAFFTLGRGASADQADPLSQDNMNRNRQGSALC